MCAPHSLHQHWYCCSYCVVMITAFNSPKLLSVCTPIHRHTAECSHIQLVVSKCTGCSKLSRLNLQSPTTYSNLHTYIYLVLQLIRKYLHQRKYIIHSEIKHQFINILLSAITLCCSFIML